MEKQVLLKNMSFSYKNKLVLKNLDLELESGNVQAVVGLNGAGKTTLLRIIAGLERPASGHVENNLKTSYVFQGEAFFPWLSVYKNLEICTKATQTEIMQNLSEFGLLAFAHRPPHELSGGTLQKVNILRAFLIRPELVLMDEPFVHLDIIQKEELYLLIKRLWEKYRSTVLLVTHDIEEAIRLSDIIYGLSKKEKTITAAFKVRAQPNCYQHVYDFLKEDFHE